MKKELTELNNEELLKKHKELKNGKIINAAIVGFTIGIFCYSALNNGFGLFTFFPLLIAYLIIKNSKNDKILMAEVEKELRTRGLE
ncbi:MAG: hypothetical protein REI64_01140 [Pedobacter sp.]|uniref:hypothetical protein n=1 Tax=Pedobacter sp. TaxID=1411316 RepID=UPI00280861A5|nr:hypothetical protein [Pedobacter sp.]MDQ8003369.1 hypothetical protein [Pedobacter sp.]